MEDSSNKWRLEIILIIEDSVKDSEFNGVSRDNAYVGYMYGTSGNSAYTLTHANTNDSKIKTYLDTWYQNILASYSSYLADAGFCNDRSIASTAGSWSFQDTSLGYGTNFTFYGSNNRLRNLNKPQFACPQSNDLFTTSSSSKGNKVLTNPIGLVTADEATYAGGYRFASNSNYYLVNERNFWTMSPFFFDGVNARDCYVDGGVGVSREFVDSDRGVRPTINLKSTVEISGGTGTSSDPYIVKVS